MGYIQRMIKQKNLPHNINENLPRLMNAFEQEMSLDAVILFGSFASGDQKPLSDIDIAVLMNRGLAPEQISETHSRLLGVITETLTTEEIDLVVLNTAPLRFSYSILKNGALVFVRNAEHLIDFREQVIKEYLDFSYYLTMFNNAFREGIGYHG